MADKKKTVEIKAIELYRLLIGELRYSYTRNNHLQPSGAYDEARKYLPLMLKADPETAINTAKQLCDECIGDELAAHFYEGLDDDSGNRAATIGFIEWLLDFVHVNGDPGYLPYNHDLYAANVERSKNLRYSLVKIAKDEFESDERISLKGEKRPIADGLSKQEAEKTLFKKVLGADAATFNRISIKTSKYGGLVIGEKLRIIEPKAHQGEIYAIVLADSLSGKKA